jgi:hypothetical protein
MSFVLAIPESRTHLLSSSARPREPGGSRLVPVLLLQNGTVLDRALTLRVKNQLGP